MKKKSSVLLFIVICFIFSIKAWAATEHNTDQVAVALVIDNSGSMKNSDPLNSRFSASRMVLDLLSESDYLSITTFSDEAVNLLPMTELKGSQFQQAEDSLLRIPPANGYTDYQKALALAEANLATLSDQNIGKFIIFLTDGKPEVRDETVDMLLYDEQLRSKVSTIGKAGYPIYTVGFGSTDPQLLEFISETTRGTSLQGGSSAVATSFFEVLKELKNRYSLLEQEIANEAEVFQFNVDEYTSRVTVLVQDESGSGQIRMTGQAGNAVEPVFQTQSLRVYHLYPDADNRSVQYHLNGKWTGSIHAVRDTKTKLWINEPIHNSQVSFESDILAKVAQTGVIGENTELRAILKQNGTPMNRDIEVVKQGTDYEVKIGRLPQTGIYELEVTLNIKNNLIAKTTSSFQVKNIPTLTSNLNYEDQVWIQGVDKKIIASLQKTGQVVTSNLNDVQMSLHLQQGNRKSTINLMDDGEEASGDLIPNDGIYSGVIKDLRAGTLSYVLTAQGDYLQEPLLLSTPMKLTKAEKAGLVEVIFPETVVHDKGKPAEIELQLTNKGTYPEEISVKVGDAAVEQSISIKPGETVKERIPVLADQPEQDVQLSLIPLHGVTNINQNQAVVRVNTAEANEGPFSTEVLFLGGFSLLATLLLILVIRKRPHRKKLPKLQGRLVYHEWINGFEAVIPLSGNQPMGFSIGKESLSQNHLVSDANPSFRFAIHPLYSDKESAVIELRCSPPGMLTKGGNVITSTTLSNGDEFDMGGLHFKYELPEVHGKGQDVLSGRL